MLWRVENDRTGPQVLNLPHERATPAAFGVAAGLVALAALARLAFEYFSPGLPPYPTFFVAVLFATLLFGAAPGLFAMLLGALAGAWFMADSGLAAAGMAASLILYFGTSLLVIWGAQHYRHIIQAAKSEERKRDRDIALRDHQNEILAQIASGAPPVRVFDKLVRTIEDLSNRAAIGSILLLDRDGVHMRLGAAPSLPDAYNRAIDGAPIGPSAGSCGTAAYRKQPVYVTDIATDPLWADYRQLALPHGLRACWSTPIMSHAGRVLGTFAIYYREPRSPTPDDLNIISYLSRAAAIAIEREQIEQQRRILVNEMNHRIKNTLATVQSIASQTLRRDLDARVYDTFIARLIGLSNAHNLLMKDHWDSVEIHELVSQAVIKPFAAQAQRVRADGPPVRLPSQMTLLMSMALHELCTNATKYGAFSNGTGTISITWATRLDTEGSPQFTLHWAEMGGPSVVPPTRKGFGARLIERALAAELGGVAMIDYREEGVVCDITAPLTTKAA
jgi:two-component sensor histidine kinase